MKRPTRFPLRWPESFPSLSNHRSPSTNIQAQIQPRWAVGDHLVWIEDGFEEGDITGVVAKVSEDGARMLIKWDDGEVDDEWWDTADEDFTAFTKK